MQVSWGKTVLLVGGQLIPSSERVEGIYTGVFFQTYVWLLIFVWKSEVVKSTGPLR